MATQQHTNHMINCSLVPQFHIPSLLNLKKRKKGKNRAGSLIVMEYSRILTSLLVQQNKLSSMIFAFVFSVSIRIALTDIPIFVSYFLFFISFLGFFYLILLQHFFSYFFLTLQFSYHMNFGFMSFISLYSIRVLVYLFDLKT